MNLRTFDYRKAICSWWNISKYHNTIIVNNVDCFQVIIYQYVECFDCLIMSNYSQTSYQTCQDF